jgi:hypothetical protein
MKLTQNVGTLDRIARIALGILVAAAFLGGVVTGPLGWAAAVVALIMLVTGAVGFCPLYALLGVRTCPLQRV